MIVSKGALTNTLDRGNGNGKAHHNSFVAGGGLPGPLHHLTLSSEEGSGSGSLPYSSRTMLTNSSRSTATTVTADRRYNQIIAEEEGHSSDENPYETLPNVRRDSEAEEEDVVVPDRLAARELPPPPLPTPRYFDTGERKAKTSPPKEKPARRNHPTKRPPPPPKHQGRPGCS